MSADAVIDGLGGTAVVAAELALDDSTVSKWRGRGIPSGRWVALAALAERKGRTDLTLEAISRMSSPALVAEEAHP